jgi:TonB family protein
MKRAHLFIFMLFSALFVAGLPVFAQSGEVFTEVDRVPKFKGKPSHPDKFFKKFMVYPDEARLNTIEGVVEVSFIVSSDGKLMEPSIEKSIDPLLDSEALRLVELMEKWKPAKKDGALVNARVNLPVTFELLEEERALMNTLKEHGLNENMPLFVLDGKIVKEYIKIPHYNVKSVRVMKGEKAIERYGQAAGHGVVIVTTKRGTPPVR